MTFRERMQIDRQLISREEFAALVSELQARVEVTRLAHDRRFRTFFELTTALAFLYFARHQVDIAVVEVGLGGRLDTTNVLTPQVAVLTPIGLEHTRLLGNTSRPLLAKRLVLLSRTVAWSVHRKLLRSWRSLRDAVKTRTPHCSWRSVISSGTLTWRPATAIGCILTGLDSTSGS